MLWKNLFKPKKEKIQFQFCVSGFEFEFRYRLAKIFRCERGKSHECSSSNLRAKNIFIKQTYYDYRGVQIVGWSFHDDSVLTLIAHFSLSSAGVAPLIGPPTPPPLPPIGPPIGDAQCINASFRGGIRSLIASNPFASANEVILWFGENPWSAVRRF